MKQCFFYLSSLFLLTETITAQTKLKELALDSLIKVSERQTKKDVSKLKTLNELAFGYAKTNPNKGIESSTLAISLAQNLNNPVLLAEAYNNKGLNHAAKNEYSIALAWFERALAINQKQKNKFGAAINNLNIGNIYLREGLGKKGLGLFETALHQFEALNNRMGIALSNESLGNYHLKNSDCLKALEFYQKALRTQEQLGNQGNIANNLSSIGKVYKCLSEFPKSFESLQNALRIYESLGYKIGMAANLNSIGSVHAALSDYTKAQEKYLGALSIYEQIGNKSEAANLLVNLAIISYNNLDYPNALVNFQKALLVHEQLENRGTIATIHGNLGNIYLNYSDYPKAFDNFQKALNIHEQIGNKAGMAFAYGGIGLVNSNLSEHAKAVENYQKALGLNEQLGNKTSLSNFLHNIGLEYYYLANYPKALDYYHKAQSVNEQIGDKNAFAETLGGIGDVYQALSDYPKFLDYNQKALSIFEQLGNKANMAINLGNIGKVYYNASEAGLLAMGIVPAERYVKALEYTNKAISINKEIGRLLGQKENYANLSEIYQKQGDFSKAYESYKNYIMLRDSIEKDAIKGKIERKEMQYAFDKNESKLKFEKQLSEEMFVRSLQELGLKEKDLELSNKEKDLQHLAYLKEKAEKQNKQKQLTISEKEKQLQETQLTVLGQEKELQQAQLETQQQEIETKKAQRNLFIAGTILMLLLASSIFMGLRRTAKEKKRSDELLLNILPAEVAEELKMKGEAEAKLIEEVTVLFTDFKGFTALSETLSPKELVSDLNDCFSAFDHIMDKHGIEKIKTIGDAYMAAGGLPMPNQTHAEDVVKAALEICQFVEEVKDRKIAQKLPYFEIRIGVHTGPVVAGIVGVKKFAYDIWGDTVNTASRMESSGEVGKVNISQSTYNLIRDKFMCIHRGKVSAKGKGEIDMYFVSSNNA